MIKRSGQKKRKIAEVILKFSHYVSKHNFEFCLEVLFVIHLISVLGVIVLNIQFPDVDCREIETLLSSSWWLWTEGSKWRVFVSGKR